MDEYIQQNLALACRHLAQQLSEEDEGLDTTSRSWKSKEKKEALQALLRVGKQDRFSFYDITDLLCAVYAGSPVQSKARQHVAQMLPCLGRATGPPLR